MKRLNQIGLCVWSLLVTSNAVWAADYYVNDNSTTNDVYTSALGNNANNGTSPATPKATLTAIWQTYGPAGTNVLTAGDVIYVDAGSYFQTDIQLDITVSGLTIQGAATTLTLFDNSGHGGTQEYFMRILASDVNLLNFTVTGYDYEPGGRGKAITVSGATDVVINGVNTIDNFNNGDAAFMVTSNSEVTFMNGASSCNAGSYGGGYRIEGRNISVLFTNCMVSQNSISSENGGGIYIEGDNGASSNIDVTIQNSTISNNQAVRGGGIYIINAELTVSNTCFSSNSGVASNDGGGALYVSDNCVVTLNNCSFTNNTANLSSADGGAISVVAQNTSVTIQQCAFTGNSANDDGNAIYLDRAFSGAAATITVNESIFGASQTVFRRSGDGANSSLTVTNSGTRQVGPGSDPIAGNNLAQTLGAPTTNCPSSSTPCLLTTLPVELLSFSGTCNNGNVNLAWQTASELNNDFFTIERINQDMQFEVLGYEQGSLNSSQTLSYYFTDSRPNPRINYYKLSQTDTDGTTKELGIISVVNQCGENGYVFFDELTQHLRYQPKGDEFAVAASLFTSAGQEVGLTSSGDNEWQPAQKLSKGIYFMRVQLSHNEVESFKVTIH